MSTNLPQCPRCHSRSAHPRGSQSRPNRYQCYECKKYFTDKGSSASQNGLRILSLDVETLPIKAYTWGAWQQNIYGHQLIADWSLLSYAAKWVGDDRIISGVLTSEESVIRDDSRITGEIWQLLDQAQIVITHNGKRFDIKKIQTRFWKHGLHKPSSYRVIDTLSAARSAFGLTYNNMDSIAKFIGADQKLDTDFELWAACDAGDFTSLSYMRQYNEQDVLTQEQIYFAMREWIPGHPSLSVYNNSNACPVCLHSRYRPIGIYTTNKNKFQEYRCEKCGSTWHSSKAMKHV